MESNAKAAGLSKERVEQDLSSRIVEREILKELHTLWKAMLKSPMADVSKILDSVEQILVRRYKEWQFLDDPKYEGLNSGACAEAFNRLVGCGIMDDLPEAKFLSEEENDEGKSVIKIRPKSPDEIGNVEFLFVITDPQEKQLSCKWTFTTSRDGIEKRLSDIKLEEKKLTGNEPLPEVSLDDIKFP